MGKFGHFFKMNNLYIYLQKTINKDMKHVKAFEFSQKEWSDVLSAENERELKADREELYNKDEEYPRNEEEKEEQRLFDLASDVKELFNKYRKDFNDDSDDFLLHKVGKILKYELNGDLAN